MTDGLITFLVDNIKKYIAGMFIGLAAISLQSNFRARQNHAGKVAIDFLEF